MGKAIGVLFVLLLIASSTTAFLPVHAESKTVVVPDDYPTIQQAINQADPGDTVYVKAGEYNGSIVIKKPIALIGQKGATINSWIIDVQPAILVTSCNVTVMGLTIDNPSISPPWKTKRGIHLLGVSNCLISNNYIAHCDAEGIWLYQSSNNRIEDNTVRLVNTCVSIGASSNNIVTNNSLGEWRGISLYNGACNNTVSGNSLFKTNVGIGISVQSNGNEFLENDLVGSDTGVAVGDNASNNLFLHNNFLGNSLNVQSSSTALDGTNYFDNGREGNYYSDYTGEDADADGIGDTPYTMVTQGADVTDHYPLMKRWAGDNLPPVITVLTPQNATYTEGEVSLNFSVSKPVSQIKYALDSNESTIISGNITLTDLANGNHTVTIYATDIAGNEAAPKTVNFNVAVPLVESLPVLPIGAVLVLGAVALGVGWLLYRRKCV